ncbi:gamma-type small acid-soluble spore protein [Salinithrix halophila]|uniref:Small, acid-soluble spore protein gamma-type n=1 Tax=Salinithrix halophila TaxID=1485204 RepID=A0ABV8JLB1_9BACL
MPYRIDQAAQQAQQSLQQIRQIAQQLQQTELQNARQFQQGAPVGNFSQREQTAAQQLNQIQQMVQQLQSSMGGAQGIAPQVQGLNQGYAAQGVAPQAFGTEFASETNVQEVRSQNQQAERNKR